MSVVVVPNYPPLEGLGARFLRDYARMVVRNDWDPRAIIPILYRESGLNPEAQLTTTDTKSGERAKCLGLERPRDCAVGLLQWNRAGVQAAGKPGTLEALRDVVKMPAHKQLTLVEKYFQNGMKGRPKPDSPADYYLVPIGRPDLINKPDSTALFRSTGAGGDAKEHRIYSINSSLDSDGDGVIDVGDMRAKWWATYEGRSGDLEVNIDGQVANASMGGGGAPLLLALTLGYFVVRKRKR